MNRLIARVITRISIMRTIEKWMRFITERDLRFKAFEIYISGVIGQLLKQIDRISQLLTFSALIRIQSRVLNPFLEQSFPFLAMYAFNRLMS